MRDDVEVTSVNVVSAVSLKTRVIGAEMEHPGASHDIAIRGLLFVSELVNYKTTKRSVDTVNLFCMFPCKMF